MILPVNQMSKSNMTITKAMPKDKSQNENPTYHFISKNDNLIMFQGKKDSFTKKEKESVNTVLKSPSLLKIILASVALSTMTPIMTTANGNGNSNKDKNYEVTAQVNPQAQNKYLTPEDWLNRWNAAWNSCYKSLGPEKVVYNNFDPNADFMSQGMPQVQPHSQAEVYEVMKENFPNLCSYLNSPKHRALLEEQYRIGAEAIQKLRLEMQQNEQRREQETELKLQEIRQRQILQQQKEANFRHELELIRQAGEIDRIMNGW
jgi:hypothetical protein